MACLPQLGLQNSTLNQLHYNNTYLQIPYNRSRLISTPDLNTANVNSALLFETITFQNQQTASKVPVFFVLN